MTLLEQIQKEIMLLPPEKQGEALDFIIFLQQRNIAKSQKKNSLRQHPAYGSWRGKNIDALKYQQNIRTEWDNRL
ncbi:MAG: DUF2281 domain-containing protein [Anaerolineales bacterium]